MGLALVSCSDGEAGDASPVSTTTTTTDAGGATSSTSKQASGNALESIDPCEVLNSVASQFNLTRIEEGDSDSCAADYSKTVTVQFDIHADRRLADYRPEPTSELSDTSVGGRKAKLVKKALTSSSCAVAVEVSATSRFDVFASANASLDEACDAATKVAAAVEPKLPK
ncbi:DUF3558 family protein [Saccharothrix coeruleofusca]|uniref:DUF3558 family protein n=1 Tax=Saccharothrix coeruleofusca TaxID=33919 RepID=UPI0016708F93|nr:DUF3558 family protein [Saccharothrix coeruleofusca]